MNPPNFAALLDEAPSEISRPKPLPAGTYVCVVQGSPRYDKSSKKQTPFVEFTLGVLTPGDDVDAEELAEMGGIEGRTIRATYYLTEDSIYRLDEFHEHCGIDLSVPASRRQRSDELTNAQVIAVLGHRASDDGSSVFAELKRTAPVE